MWVHWKCHDMPTTNVYNVKTKKHSWSEWKKIIINREPILTPFHNIEELNKNQYGSNNRNICIFYGFVFTPRVTSQYFLIHNSIDSITIILYLLRYHISCYRKTHLFFTHFHFNFFSLFIFFNFLFGLFKTQKKKFLKNNNNKQDIFARRCGNSSYFL